MATQSLPQTCSIEDCQNPISCRSWCEMHYTRWRRSGCALDNPKVAITTPERFWQNKTVTENGCWVYHYTDKAKGYGKVRYQGRQWKAHRLAFLLHHRHDPKGMVLHSCDNPPCINPAHLREGTAKENTFDMVTRNRNLSSRSITEDTALKIKQQLQDGISTRQVAKNLDTTRNVVRSIQRGGSWNQVKLPAPYQPDNGEDGGGA